MCADSTPAHTDDSRKSCKPPGSRKRTILITQAHARLLYRVPLLRVPQAAHTVLSRMPIGEAVDAQRFTSAVRCAVAGDRSKTQGSREGHADGPAPDEGVVLNVGASNMDPGSPCRKIDLVARGHAYYLPRLWSSHPVS